MRGGVDSKDNIRPAHLFCNESRGSKDFLDIDTLGKLRSRIFELQKNSEIETIDSNIIHCEYCKEEFYAENARVIRYSKKFCSDSCRNKSLERKTSKTCLQCSVEFNVVKSRSVLRGKYCSKSCYSKSSGGVERVCVLCEKAYYASEKNKRKAVLLYCSKCRMKKN